MPYVPVPKDLTKVKTKLAFNLTKRQLICFSLFEARHAGGAEAALAGDDFVALVRSTDDDRADDALFLLRHV